MGVRVGALKYWMESEAPDGEGSMTDMCPFVKRAISQCVAENEAAWREFELAGKKSYCYREYVSADPNSQWLMGVLIPHLQELRGLARLARWRAHVQLEQGDSSGTVDSGLAVIRAGRDLQRFPTLVEQLVGTAMNSIGHKIILRTIAAEGLSDEALQDLNERLRVLYPDGYPMFDIEFEKLAFHDAIQHVFTDGGPGGGHIIPRQLASLSNGSGSEVDTLMELSMGLVHARRNDTVKVVDRLFGQVSEIQELTPFQRRQAGRSTADFLSELSNYRYTLVQILMPALDRIFELGYRSQTEHQGLLTVLALQRWKTDKGSYPTTLDELVTAGLLLEVPKDPFGDGPLTYRRLDDDFTLYCFGTNLKDDNGKPGITRRGNINRWTDNGDAVLWPVMD